MNGHIISIFLALCVALPVANAKKNRRTSRVHSSRPQSPTSSEEPESLAVWTVGKPRVVKAYAGAAAQLAKRLARDAELSLRRVSKAGRRKLKRLSRECSAAITDDCLRRAAELCGSSLLLTLRVELDAGKVNVDARLHHTRGEMPVLAQERDQWTRKTRRKAARDLAGLLGSKAKQAIAALTRDGATERDGSLASAASAASQPTPEPAQPSAHPSESAQQEGDASTASTVEAGSEASQLVAQTAQDKGGQRETQTPRSAETDSAPQEPAFSIEGWDSPEEDDPILVHAWAANAELDGDVATALELVRQAHALSPDDPYFAYELARLAHKTSSPTLESDATAFLGHAPSTPAEHTLRGHILVRLGRPSEARDHDASAADRVGGGPESLSMQGVFAAQDRPANSRLDWLSLSLSAATQYDTNVSVLPEDSPVHDAGARSALSGSVVVAPKAGPFQLAAFAAGHYSRHINNRSALSLYDVTAAMAGINIQHARGPLRTSLSVLGSEIFLQDFATHFMQEGKVRAEVRSARRGSDIGFFVVGGYRDFIHGNQEGPSNRDGATFELGLVANLQLPYAIKLRSSLGVQRELAQGRQQQETGAGGSVAASWQSGDWCATASLDARMRYYRWGKVADETQDELEARFEQRITPSLTLRYTLASNYAVVGSATTMKNLSNAGFGYTRHMIQLGVETRW